MTALWKAKRVDNNEWVKGYLWVGADLMLIIPYNYGVDYSSLEHKMKAVAYEVKPDTVSKNTNILDEHYNTIDEGDVLQYPNNEDDDLVCRSVVRIGKYTQDGSGGEYKGRTCVGVYVSVLDFDCPEWAKDKDYWFPEHLKEENLQEVASKCVIIGNVFDNPELLGGNGNDKL